MKVSTIVPLVGALAFLHGPLAFLEGRPTNPSSKPPKAITAERIEADWLRQDVARGALKNEPIAPEDDARGGCDGVKTGKWGFHTENEDRPWWQVDLGRPMPLDEIRLYNRCDGGFADRNRRIMVLVSDDGESWNKVYQHDGTSFLGKVDNKPLAVALAPVTARYVRLQLPGRSYFHLDEVEVYAPNSRENVALCKPATQSSTSQWSVRHATGGGETKSYATPIVVERGLRLAESLRLLGVNVDEEAATLRDVASRMGERSLSDQGERRLYLQARWAVRRMSLSNPLLDFDAILFVKRAPGTLPHMSDQYYGWWSRPGGGLYLLEGFKGDNPRVRCLTNGWPEGSFLRPDISHDGRKVVFAYCRYHPQVAAMEKVDKDRLPEDAFYSIFEMHLDGSGARQLTRGRYDDFDARYLPNGEIVFLSTRKGQFIQCTQTSTQSTVARTRPDSYVRCGGDNRRPCAVFTLHVMDADGNNLRPISAFENFEWTPSVADDGRVVYARWDYIDRFNGHYMSLWSTNPDGTNPQLVYGNFTIRPQAIFEARSIPGSHKLICTASAHHSITGGSLVLLDRTIGTEGERPLTRLTPEVPFPETEGWVDMYYANPYPLSEDYFLVAWSDRRLPPHAGSQQVRDGRNPPNALGLYLYDAHGNLEPLYRDPDLSSMHPLPVRPRKKPPALPTSVDWAGKQEGHFLLQDVYQGLSAVPRGAIQRLRVVAVVPKPQPHMNSPNLGVSREDPGKFILGTVPVEKDGSAYFRVPSGLPVFFQALDADGLAVQTMRTLTYVQPNQTLSCIGCHESRELAPAVGGTPLAAKRAPSRLTPGPDGSWPLEFGRLVQPVLDRHCVGCHRSDSEDAHASRFDLTPGRSYQNLISYADKDLEKLAFEKPRSIVGDSPAAKSKLLALLTQDDGHEGVKLDRKSHERLVTWMDVYAQRQGSFSESQEDALRKLRDHWRDLLTIASH